MKNYEAPELISAGTISEVVLGAKTNGPVDEDLKPFPTMTVLDID